MASIHTKPSVPSSVPPAPPCLPGASTDAYPPRTELKTGFAPCPVSAERSAGDPLDPMDPWNQERIHWQSFSKNIQSHRDSHLGPAHKHSDADIDYKFDDPQNFNWYDKDYWAEHSWAAQDNWYSSGSGSQNQLWNHSSGWPSSKRSHQTRKANARNYWQ
eukprot:gnl/MRDRNA2_/MRDRNA2_211329_c0_seq1.p2 gnl/MRDRNA2_/MRDRNA2_211329_c0~~gnl/MRDRNA2_/MRDRNA2_211329_c0_seq1.p2  ORF type:complete len:160 (-),score=22.06 gnl/MRDRNA2_/MRDRNA2_211329_c0_seq1:16-495(-)